MHSAWKHLVAGLALLVCAASDSAASPPPGPSLHKMIAHARAVAIVRIENIEPLKGPDPRRYMAGEGTSRTATLRVKALLRGQFDDTFPVHIFTNTRTASDPKVGDEALAFAGQLPGEPERGVPGHVFLFDDAVGFWLVRDLIAKDDGRQDAVVRESIKQAVARYKPPQEPNPGGLYTPLNFEAEKPFFDLLKSQHVPVRHWAIVNCAGGLRLREWESQALISYLKDGDKIVRETAATKLMYAHGVTEEPLRACLKMLGREEVELAQQINGYIEGRRILAHMAHLDPELRTRLQHSVAKITAKGAKWTSLDFRMTERGVRAEAPDADMDVLVAEAVEEHLNRTPNLQEGSPLAGFSVQLWIEDGKLQIQVSERRRPLPKKSPWQLF